MLTEFPFDKINKVAAIGDSITYGMSSSSPDKCWVSRLGAMLQEFSHNNIQIINKGICGNILCTESSAYEFSNKPAGLERFREDIISQDPDLILVAYGLNDSRGGTDPLMFRRDYQKMIDELKKSTHAVIAVLDLYYMHEEFYSDCQYWDHSNYEITEEFNLIIRQLAEKNGLIFADVYSAQKGLDWAVCPDHCHPNDLGHLLIANKVFESIIRSADKFI